MQSTVKAAIAHATETWAAYVVEVASVICCMAGHPVLYVMRCNVMNMVALEVKLSAALLARARGGGRLSPKKRRKPWHCHGVTCQIKLLEVRRLDKDIAKVLSVGLRVEEILCSSVTIAVSSRENDNCIVFQYDQDESASWPRGVFNVAIQQNHSLDRQRSVAKI